MPPADGRRAERKIVSKADPHAAARTLEAFLNRNLLERGIFMRITAGAWQQEKKSVYKADQRQEKKGMDSADGQQEDKEEISVYAKKATQNTPWGNPAGAAQKQAVNPSGNSGKIKASIPDDQVGQLASELANSETKFDVQNVSSKAMRALANLRMSGALSEGEDKKKIAQMIRRMEKLLKRVRTKMKNLTKEEQLENQQKQAQERKKEQEARELRDELRTRRTKRRRDERNYALKETARDAQNAAAANASLPTTGAAAPSLPSAEILSAASSVDVAAVSAESVSLDVTV